MVFRNSHKFTIILTVFILLLLLPIFFKGSYLIDFLVLTAVWVIFATSLRLLTTLGLVSFGHNGFLAIGAYSFALLTMKLSLSFWLALLLSGLAAGIIGLIIGYPILKIKSHYFFIASFALGAVIELVFSTQWRDVLGGPMGISNIPYASPAFASPVPHYYLVLGWATLIIGMIYRLDNCRIGIEWRGIRGADDLAALLGIDIFKTKIIAFVTACFFAGVSGSLYAHYMRFIAPESFGFPMMLFCLSCVIVGGMYSTWGPALGVLLLRGVTVAAGGLRQWEVLTYAGILILCITLLPEGITSLPQRIKEGYKGLKWRFSKSES